ncbi:MAG TPA: hypothetical protein VGP68_09225 [Gemmataceae bacterium]|jgi:hypothetical protein|nr:hypothetical protein [Gemmataceae bacterium]
MSMVNRLLIATLVLLAGVPANAADDGLNGNFKLIYFQGVRETPLTIVKLETKDGKLEGSVVAGGQIRATGVNKVSMDGKILHFDLVGGSAISFEGLPSGAEVPGSISIGNGANVLLAKLVKTTDEAMTATLLKVPEYTEASLLENKAAQLQAQAQRTTDEDKKAELLKQIPEAKKKAATEVPKLYRAVIEKHPDSPVVFTVGYALLGNAKFKVTPQEASQCAAAISKLAEKHGPRFANNAKFQLARVVAANTALNELSLEIAKNIQTTLTDKSTNEDRVRALKMLLAALKKNSKADEAKAVQDQVAKLELEIAKKAEAALTEYTGNEQRIKVMKMLIPALQENGKADEAKTVEVKLAKLELEIAKKAEAALTDDSSPEQRIRVLKALVPALKENGKADEAKTAEAELAKLEEPLDKDYLAKVPPFKPEMFAGRKEKADRRVVMELFTGAQCPPCVAADVAFDALSKSYKPSELILLQYHLHIPGPDPMTNADTEARANYYDVHSTPSTLFNGEPAAGGGGAMAGSEGKYDAYCKVIDPRLETNSDAKLLLTAKQMGNKIDIKAEVSGLKDPSEQKRLRLVLVEETIRYVGGNKLRFHHHVVRAMPGGVEGFALKAQNSQHSASVNLDELRAQLIKYLDNYAQETRPFPYPDRPLDFKHLKVVGLVQDDESKEILEVLQVDVTGDLTTTTRLGAAK